MKYYLIAGEASGDLHGSNLMKEIKRKDPDAEFRFWGGDLMQKQGGILVKHFRELAFMGFAEVILNLRTILTNIQFCKKDLQEFQPDALILIDYPGFNLRIAKFAKLQMTTKIFYYISPQLWAWKPGRVTQIRDFVDKMFVILPFEKAWYESHSVEVDFVGHPLLDAIQNLPRLNRATFIEENKLEHKPIIALLPGSRKQEIEQMLSEMIKLKKRFPAYQFVVAGAPSQTKEFYQNLVGNDIKIIENKTYPLLQVATAALVTSGTATLETALFGVPQVVCYRGSYLSYQIGKRLVSHIKFISLVNLIMDKEVVKELIQNDFTAKNLTRELTTILSYENASKIKNEYAVLQQKLGGVGASARTAQFIFAELTV